MKACKLPVLDYKLVLANCCHETARCKVERLLSGLLTKMALRFVEKDQLGTKTIAQNLKGMESKTGQFGAIKDLSGQAASIPYRFIYQVFY